MNQKEQNRWEGSLHPTGNILSDPNVQDNPTSVCVRAYIGIRLLGEYPIGLQVLGSWCLKEIENLPRSVPACVQCLKRRSISERPCDSKGLESRAGKLHLIEGLSHSQ